MTNRYTAMTVLLLFLSSFCACMSCTGIHVLELRGSIETTTVSGDSIRRIALVGDVIIAGTLNINGVPVVDLKQCRSLKVEGELFIMGNSRTVTRIILPDCLFVVGSGHVSFVNSEVFTDLNEPMLFGMQHLIPQSCETRFPPLPVGNLSEYSKLIQDVSAVTNHITWSEQEKGGKAGYLTLRNSIVLASFEFENGVMTELDSSVVLGKKLEMSVAKCVNSRVFELSGRLGFSGRVDYSELSGSSYMMFNNCELHRVLIRSTEEDSNSRKVRFSHNNTIDILVVCGGGVNISISQKWKCSNAVFLGNHSVELNSRCTNADIQNCMWISVPNFLALNADLGYDQMIIYAKKTNKEMREISAKSCLFINGHFGWGVQTLAVDKKISFDVHDIVGYFTGEEIPDKRNGKYSFVKKADGTYDWSHEQMESSEIKIKLMQHSLYRYILPIVKGQMPEIFPLLSK